MEPTSESTNTLQSLSQDLASAVERVSTAVVAINARRHFSSSGVCWRDGVIVTAAHTLRRTEDISVLLPSGEAIAATLAGLTQVGAAATRSDHSTTKFFKRFSAKLVFSGALEYHFPRQIRAGVECAADPLYFTLGECT
jgi:S1-C subfamily serine protease